METKNTKTPASVHTSKDHEAHTPNATTMKAIDEAMNSNDLEVLNIDNFDAYVAAL